MFEWLLNSSEFVIRSHCGNWSWYLQLAYQGSSLLIAGAYFAIPCTLYVLYHKRKKSLPKSWIFVLFVAFIFLCGLTHVGDYLVFHWAPYRLYTAILALTAAVSVPTAILLPGVVRYILTLKTPAEYQQIINELDLMILQKRALRLEIEKQNLSLRQEIHEMRNTMQSLAYAKNLHEEMAQLQEHLKKIREAGLVISPSVTVGE